MKITGSNLEVATGRQRPEAAGEIANARINTAIITMLSNVMADTAKKVNIEMY